MAAVPAPPLAPFGAAAAGSAPRRALWLRLEWNMLRVDQLQGVAQQLRQRGLIIDIPQVSRRVFW